MQTKVCTKCKQELTLDHFSKHNTCKYGVKSICRQCEKLRPTKKKVMFPEPINLPETKVCMKCGIDKPLSEYMTDKYRPDWKRGNCKECCKSLSKTYKRKESDSPDNYSKTKTKQCTKCGEHKLLSEFHRHKHGLYGVDSFCAECKNKVTADRYNPHPRVKPDPSTFPDHKICVVCGIDKKLTKYTKSKRGLYGHVSRCKQCSSLYDFMYCTKNKEKRNKYNRDYLKTNMGKLVTSRLSHKRRAQKEENGIYEVSIKFMNRLSSQIFCSYCGERLVKGKKHIEHIIPIAKGGSHSEGNLTMTCDKCNLSKGAKFLIAWKSLQKKIKTNT